MLCVAGLGVVCIWDGFETPRRSNGLLSCVFIFELFFLELSCPGLLFYRDQKDMSSAYDVFDVHLNCIYHKDKLNRKFNAQCDAYLHDHFLASSNSSVQWLCLARGGTRSTEVHSKATPLYIPLFAQCSTPPHVPCRILLAGEVLASTRRLFFLLHIISMIY